jgi:outer membrane protein OmpA-like peptidoglycan-associated protein
MQKTPYSKNYLLKINKKCIAVRLYLFIIIALASNILACYGQLYDIKNPYLRFQYGLFATFDYLEHKPDFTSLPGIPCCAPSYTGGSGYGFSGGLFAEFPFNNMFFGMLRLGYSYSANKFSNYEGFIYNLDGVPFTGEIEYLLKPYFHTGIVDILAGFRPIGSFYFLGGFRVGYTFAGTFDQKEEIKHPSFGVFENGSRTRNVFNGADINDLSRFSLSGLIGAAIEFPLNESRSIRIAPEINLSFGLLSPIKDSTWTINSINAGFSLKFSKEPFFDLFAEIQPMDSIVVKHNKSCKYESLEIYPDYVDIRPFVFSEAGIKSWSLSCVQDNIRIAEFSGEGDSIPPLILPVKSNSGHFTKANGNIQCVFHVWDNDGKETTSEQLIPFRRESNRLGANLKMIKLDELGLELTGETRFTVEKRMSTNIIPLLSTVFFDESESDIASKYIKIKTRNNEIFKTKKTTFAGALDNYYNNLNYIGKRMAESPDLDILIEGTNSGSGDERGDTALARARAQVVADYLQTVWNIQPSRIKVFVNPSTKGAPRHPSIPREDENIEEALKENMRVEISSFRNDNDISKPIFFYDTSYSVTASAFRFYPQVETNTQIAYWKLNVNRNGRNFKTFSGTTLPPESLDVALLDNISEICSQHGDFEYEFFIRNTLNQECRFEGKIPVSIYSRDSSLNLFALLLFSFDRYDLTETNKNILNNVRKLLKNGSVITITGYTDKFGPDGLNDILSKNRAVETAAKLFGIEFPENLLKEAPVGKETIFSNKKIVFDNNGVPVEVTLNLKGVGKKQPYLFDNSSPEGRFYSRSVTIEAVIPD